MEHQTTEKDSLFISCLGYDTKRLGLQKFSDSIIFLSPKTFELHEILISSKNYSIKEILEKTKENLDKNYEFDYSKNKLFYRDSYHTNVLKSDIELKESSIPEINQRLIDNLMNAFPKSINNYTEILGTKYGKINNYKLQKLPEMEALFTFYRHFFRFPCKATLKVDFFRENSNYY